MTIEQHSNYEVSWEKTWNHSLWNKKLIKNRRKYMEYFLIRQKKEIEIHFGTNQIYCDLRNALLFFIKNRFIHYYFWFDSPIISHAVGFSRYGVTSFGWKHRWCFICKSITRPSLNGGIEKKKREREHFGHILFMYSMKLHKPQFHHATLSVGTLTLNLNLNWTSMRRLCFFFRYLLMFVLFRILIIIRSM